MEVEATGELKTVILRLIDFTDIERKEPPNRKKPRTAQETEETYRRSSTKETAKPSCAFNDVTAIWPHISAGYQQSQSY
jgi:hypothetical protein